MNLNNKFFIVGIVITSIILISVTAYFTFRTSDAAPSKPSEEKAGDRSVENSSSPASNPPRSVEQETIQNAPTTTVVEEPSTDNVVSNRNPETTETVGSKAGTQNNVPESTILQSAASEPVNNGPSTVPDTSTVNNEQENQSSTAAIATATETSTAEISNTTILQSTTSEAVNNNPSIVPATATVNNEQENQSSTATIATATESSTTETSNNTIEPSQITTEAPTHADSSSSNSASNSETITAIVVEEEINNGNSDNAGGTEQISNVEIQIDTPTHTVESIQTTIETSDPNQTSISNNEQDATSTTATAEIETVLSNQPIISTENNPSTTGIANESGTGNADAGDKHTASQTPVITLIEQIPVEEVNSSEHHSEIGQNITPVVETSAHKPVDSNNGENITAPIGTNGQKGQKGTSNKNKKKTKKTGKYSSKSPTEEQSINSQHKPAETTASSVNVSISTTAASSDDAASVGNEIERDEQLSTSQAAAAIPAEENTSKTTGTESESAADGNLINKDSTEVDRTEIDKGTTVSEEGAQNNDISQSTPQPNNVATEPLNSSEITAKDQTSELDTTNENTAQPEPASTETTNELNLDELNEFRKKVLLNWTSPENVTVVAQYISEFSNKTDLVGLKMEFVTDKNIEGSLQFKNEEGMHAKYTYSECGDQDINKVLDNIKQKGLLSEYQRQIGCKGDSKINPFSILLVVPTSQKEIIDKYIEKINFEQSFFTEQTTCGPAADTRICSVLNIELTDEANEPAKHRRVFFAYKKAGNNYKALESKYLESSGKLSIREYEDFFANKNCASTGDNEYCVPQVADEPIKFIEKVLKYVKLAGFKSFMDNLDKTDTDLWTGKDFYLITSNNDTSLKLTNRDTVPLLKALLDKPLKNLTVKESKVKEYEREGAKYSASVSKYILSADKSRLEIRIAPSKQYFGDGAVTNESLYKEMYLRAIQPDIERSIFEVIENIETNGIENEFNKQYEAYKSRNASSSVNYLASWITSTPVTPYSPLNISIVGNIDDIDRLAQAIESKNN